jgi:hypothetical protein
MKFERGAFSVWWVISVMSGIPAAWSWMLCPSSSRSLLFQRRRQRPNILLRQQPKNMEDVDDENEPSATSFFSDDDCFDLCEVTDDEKDNEKDNRPLDVPTFGETTPQPVTATTSSQTTTAATSTTIPDEECYDLCDTEDLVVESPEETKQPNVAAAASETRKPGSGNARHRLMLQWEVTHSIEECDVDLDNLYQDNDLSTTAAAAAAAEEEPCGAMACKTCQGEGVVSCRFCAGCGFLTVGNEQVMMGTGTTCPICQAGEEACPSCRGSGWIARWQPDMHIVSNNSSNGDTL